ncbi:MAG: cyclase family protein [Methanomicrobiales archaeon]|nr:cyclase family protein [Methanomicrobiales archaeon]
MTDLPPYPACMRIFDITRPLDAATMVFPGDPAPVFVEEDAGGYRITHCTLSSHAGTHIDAPAHLFPGGMTVDAIPPSRLCVPVVVVDCREVQGAVTAADLAGSVHEGAGVLIRTRYSETGRFSPDYPYLSVDAARYLAGRRVAILGVDTPSVDRYGGDLAAHRLLLGEGTPIIELLDLAGVAEGRYFMVALPLRIRNLDGSPARVLLFQGLPGAIP